MGREIVRQESPEDPGKHSRLWRFKDSFTVLREKTGMERIEGFVLDMNAFKEVNSAHTIFSPNHAKEHSFEIDALARMCKLRLLRLSYVPLSGSYEQFPKGLRWLCWRGFALESIPLDFPVESLVALDVRYSSLKQVWKRTKFLELKILNLSHSHNLAKTPDFSVLSNLERLILKDCTRLVKVHESIGNLDRLVYLNLKDCKNLRRLPQSIIMLNFLETLIISGCSKLVELPTELRKLESLKVFAADGIAINQLLATTGEAKSWQEFVWSLVVSMPRTSPEISWASLPNSIVSLSLADCNISDDAFPRDFSSLPSLQNLNLSKNPSFSLPDCIRGHTRLQTLQLESCERLQSLVGLPSVRKLNVSECTSLERITFQSLLTASEIAFAQCHNLLEFQPFFKIEPIGEVDTELINLLGSPDLASIENCEVDFANRTLGVFHTKKCPIQALHEYDLFSTFFPGREVPSWFIHRCMGSSISLTVPSLPNLRVRGVNVFSVYAVSDDEKDKLPRPLFAKIRNKSKGLKWIYGPSCFGIPEVDRDMIWLSHWKLGNHLDGGDEVSVSIFMDVGFEVKECGINLVYEQEERLGTQENTLNPSHQGAIDGNLSRHEVMAGTYFLSDLISKVYDWSSSGWLDKLMSDSNDTSDNELELTVAAAAAGLGSNEGGGRCRGAMARNLLSLAFVFCSSLSKRQATKKEKINRDD